jgi:replication factor A1
VYIYLVLKLKVKELAPKMRADVTVKVINIGESRSVIGKDGSPHKVTDVLVGDESGTIIMSLWDEKVNKVSEGKVINIKNGFVSLHRGSMRLTLGREGEIRESNVEIGEVNNKVNLSDKVFEERRRFKRF